MGNSSLRKAQVAKNDEFYTQLSDVEREVCQYTRHFKGKVVYCNCDNPLWSNYVKFFVDNFQVLGLKRLYASGYIKDGKGVALNYSGKGVPTAYELEGPGDFRSAECVELLKEADIVVTNPPFSLFREYVAQLVEYGKQFLVIGNKNAITYKEIFPLIKDNKLWLGITSPTSFDTPDAGVTKKVTGLCRWFTNLEHGRRNEEIILYREYTPEKYPTYDNYAAINVDKVADIPCDYTEERVVTSEELQRLRDNGFQVTVLEEL